MDADRGKEASRSISEGLVFSRGRFIKAMKGKRSYDLPRDMEHERNVFEVVSKIVWESHKTNAIELVAMGTMKLEPT